MQFKSKPSNRTPIQRIVWGTSMGLSVLFIVNDPALADEPVLAPKAGLTYTLATTVTTNGELVSTNAGLVSSEHVTTITSKRKVLNSDGISHTVQVTSTDMNSTDPNIKAAKNSSPENTSTYRYFLMTENISTQRNAQTAPGKTEDVTQKYNWECDKASLQSFFPLGHIPRVSVQCTMTILGNGASRLSRPTTYVLSYEGKSNIDLPSGKFTVQNVRATTTLSNNTTEDALYLIDEKTGLTVSSETIRKNGNVQTSLVKSNVTEIR